MRLTSNDAPLKGSSPAVHRLQQCSQVSHNDYVQLHTCQKAGYLSAHQACWCHTIEHRVPHVLSQPSLYPPACTVGRHTSPCAMQAWLSRSHRQWTGPGMQDLLPAQRHRRSPSKVMSPRYVGNINGQAVPFTNAFGDDKVLHPPSECTDVAGIYAQGIAAHTV